MIDLRFDDIRHLHRRTNPPEQPVQLPSQLVYILVKWILMRIAGSRFTSHNFCNTFEVNAGLESG